MRSIRKKIKTACFGRRRRILLPLLFLASFLCWSLSRATRDPSTRTPEQDLEHYRRSRSLKHYLDNVQALIEPSTPCGHLEEVPLVVMVSSAPKRFQQRDAIRQTWAKHQPTYFVMGLNEDGADNSDEQLINNYIEAKQYSDIIVFDFEDHLQNSTLKTALMLQWINDKCPIAQFLFKTHDDVVINPWVMKLVMKDNEDAKLVGYTFNNTKPQRGEHGPRYLPWWLYHEELVPQYLAGSGYLISGEYIKKVLRAAYQVPMINVEDVYFTYSVAKEYLRFSLTHDSRLTPYRPWSTWFNFKCAYWVQAAVHGLDASEIIRIWFKIEYLGKAFGSNKDICAFYSRYVSSFVFQS